MTRKCIVWGAGNYGRRLVPMLDEEGYAITAFCDMDRELEGSRIHGYEVISVDKAAEMCRGDKGLSVIIGIFDYAAAEDVKGRIRDQFPDHTDVKSGHDIQDAYENRILRLCHQNMVFRWNVELGEAFQTWLDHLMSEAAYWVKEVADRRGRNHGYNVMCRKNDSFDHKEILREIRADETVMDIGCGLVSRFGSRLGHGGTVKLVPVDALAHFYNVINDRIQDGYKKDYRCRFGLFEFLGNTFGRNYADYIIVDNALDHCIDPWRSLVECLYVLKTDGRMYMNHRRAEAVYEGWSGLHRWNIDCDGGELIIWNKENAVNVTERLKEIADISVTYDDAGGVRERQNLGVRIVKKKDFELSAFLGLHKENAVLTGMVDRLMEKLSSDSRVFLDMLEGAEYM